MTESRVARGLAIILILSAHLPTGAAGLPSATARVAARPQVAAQRAAAAPARQYDMALPSRQISADLKSLADSAPRLKEAMSVLDLFNIDDLTGTSATGSKCADFRVQTTREIGSFGSAMLTMTWTDERGRYINSCDVVARGMDYVDRSKITLDVSAGSADTKITAKIAVSVRTGGRPPTMTMAHDVNIDVVTRPVTMRAHARGTLTLESTSGEPTGGMTVDFSFFDDRYRCQIPYEPDKSTALACDLTHAGQKIGGIRFAGDDRETLRVTDAAGAVIPGGLELASPDALAGTRAMTPGSTLPPVSFTLPATAAVDVEQSGLEDEDCTGTTTAQPTLVLERTGPSPTLIFQVTSSSDTALVVRAPDGQWSCADDSDVLNPRVRIDPAPQGRYDVWVTRVTTSSARSTNSARSTTGALLVTERLAADRPATSVTRSCPPLPISFGTPAAGTLSETDCVSTYRTASRSDGYTFQASAGLRVAISMRGSFDTHLVLTGPNGAVVAQNDDADGTDSRIQALLASTGSYTIDAAGYNRSALGTYTLTLLADTAPRSSLTGAARPAAGDRLCAATPISIGAPARATLTALDCPSDRRAGASADRYTFEGRTGQRITITMQATFDTYLVLTGPTGRTLTQNDDADGTNARIEWSLPSTGSYTISAEGYDGVERGSYTLTLATADEKPTPAGTSPAAATCVATAVVVGVPVSGTLSPGDCASPRRSGSRADRYTVQGRSGQRLIITMQAPFDTYLVLVDPAGRVVAENDDADGTNARIEVQLAAAGTYTIEATGFGNERGTYTLSVR